jgi:hypothetical protein
MVGKSNGQVNYIEISVHLVYFNVKRSSIILILHVQNFLVCGRCGKGNLTLQHRIENFIALIQRNLMLP